MNLCKITLMKYIQFLFILSFFLFLVPFKANCQGIVNTEKLYQNDTSKFGIVLEPGIDIQTGNTNVTEYYGTLNMFYRPHKLLNITTVAGTDVLQENKVSIIQEYFGQFRVLQKLSDRWSVFEFAQLQSSKNLLLLNRRLTGVSGRFNTFNADSSKFQLDLSFGAIYEQEKLDANSLTNFEFYQNKIQTDVFRLSIIKTLSYEFNENVSISNTVYYQPILVGMNDYRILNETDVALGIMSWLDLNLNWMLRYDSTPPDVLKQMDFFFTMGAVIHYSSKE